MNKAEQLFRSLFADVEEYLHFLLANKVIVDHHEAESEETGEHFLIPYVRVVSKDNDKHHVVSEDKPSYVQYHPRVDAAVMNWIVGGARFTRKGNKPVSVRIDFGSGVEFIYEGDQFNPETVDWEELFPELCSPDLDPIGMASPIVDSEILDWSFLSRPKSSDSAAVRSV